MLKKLSLCAVSLGLGCLIVGLSNVRSEDYGEDAVTSVYDDQGKPVFLSTSVKYLVGSQDSEYQLFVMYDWEHGYKCTNLVIKPATFAQRCAQFYVGE